MSRCTWQGCECEADRPQIAKDGSRWANLCKEHDAQLSKTVADLNPQQLLKDWIKAQGGAAAAARRM